MFVVDSFSAIQTGVFFSGKITNSCIQYLSRKGVDIERLYEMTDLPTEFLQDPSCWLPSSDVEEFLSLIEREAATHAGDHGSLMMNIGHECHTLRAWGVLDGVLKMMQKPSDIYLQPQRFISYFVSPAPPIGNLQRFDESVAFDLPISNTEFPLTTEYLRAALEALPVYVGKSMASARWRQTKLTVTWCEAQSSMLGDPEYVFKPELVHDLVTSLEIAQRELEAQKQIVIAQKQELEALRDQIKQAPEKRAVTGLDEDAVVTLRSHVLRLSDYLTRGQQLVTLLVKQDRLDRQVQEAMRRVDWDFVSVQYREVVEALLKGLDAMKSSAKPKVLKSTRKRNATNLELNVSN